MKLVFATHNKNKLHEVQNKLSGAYEIVGLDDIGCREDIPETGHTLEQNAWIKARYVAEKYGMDCFADDTGLLVDALDGAPGVYSARYAGEHGDAQANMDKLLRELRGKSNRNARFETVIALIWRGSEYLFRGSVHGAITLEKSGKDGFGYDPIFQPDGFSETFAQMTLEQKNEISHRGRAVAELIHFLSNRENY